MLTNLQKEDLQEAITKYDFPQVAYDFKSNVELQFDNMLKLESYIFKQLSSQDSSSIKDGLSNVLYWGYATSGYGKYRVDQFRQNVTEEQMMAAQQLFQKTLRPTIASLKALSMPQFSGISFISKIRMFLSPDDSAILDRQIMKMKFTNHGEDTILANFSHTQNETQIRASNPNSLAYEAWCTRLFDISSINFDSQYRVVDIERGFFILIRNGMTDYAVKILTEA